MIARALTVAGSDPSGGAGLQQDLATFHAFGVWGVSAVTAVTVQSTTNVAGWHRVAPQAVADQIAAALRDGGVGAAKTGMLPDVAVVEAVVRSLIDHRIEQLVVDPVLAATAGGTLTDGDVVDAVRRLLVPRALLVTPNADEAHALTGIEVVDRETQREAARAILGLGARAALVTGGHLDGDAVDVLAHAEGLDEFDAPRLEVGPVHGTGCMLSAAITAGLARGRELGAAVGAAKAFVTGGIEHAARFGPEARAANPLWRGSGAGDPAGA